MTRASIFEKYISFKEIDRRVKPGDDDEDGSKPMAVSVKRIFMRGDLANARDNLACRYWIALMDVRKNRIKLRQRGPVLI